MDYRKIEQVGITVTIHKISVCSKHDCLYPISSTKI